MPRTTTDALGRIQCTPSPLAALVATGVVEHRRVERKEKQAGI